MRSRLVPVILLLLLGLWAGSPAWAEARPGAKVRVFVGIAPIAYFVERVGGQRVDISVLVGPGQDPHTFDPTPRLVAKLADTQVLFKIGFPFEDALINKMGATFEKAQVVDLQQGIKLRGVTEQEGQAEHDNHADIHEEEHAHAHKPGEMDQHTWLDPRLAKIQAQTIAETLVRIDPSGRAEYERNLQAFMADLDAVHEQLAKALAPVKGKRFFVFHPAYGYFADAYGLKQVSVQIGGKEPTAKQLVGLVKLAKENGVRVIFVEPQFSKKSAEALAKAVGGAVVSLDPLAWDYLKNLQDIAAKLETALRSQER